MRQERVGMCVCERERERDRQLEGQKHTEKTRETDRDTHTESGLHEDRKTPGIKKTQRQGERRDPQNWTDTGAGAGPGREHAGGAGRTHLRAEAKEAPKTTQGQRH